MGRVTELIHYINQEHEPTALEKKEYNYITFTEKIVRDAKKYRKEIKRRKNEYMAKRKAIW